MTKPFDCSARVLLRLLAQGAQSNVICPFTAKAGLHDSKTLWPKSKKARRFWQQEPVFFKHPAFRNGAVTMRSVAATLFWAGVLTATRASRTGRGPSQSRAKELRAPKCLVRGWSPSKQEWLRGGREAFEMCQCFRRRDSVDPGSELIFFRVLRCCAQESKGCAEHFTCERSKEDEWLLVVSLL